MPMLPWRYTDDMTQRFNVARAMLGDNDPETAKLSDQNITSTLTVFGWQGGMVMLAQQILVWLNQEVIRSQETGGSSYQWSEHRSDAILAVIQRGTAGVLPDPELGAVITLVPGSIVLANQPTW